MLLKSRDEVQRFVFCLIILTLTLSLQLVANMMLRMKREFAGSQNQTLPVFDKLLLLDRNVDLLTPLATQLTYEGLIDEIYGIQNSKCWRPTFATVGIYPNACCKTLQ